MDNMEFIEDYFKGNHRGEDRKIFENKIMEDPAFVEEVAFYVTSQEALKLELREEKVQGFREIYDREKVVKMKKPVRQLWKYMAAAGIIIVLLLAAWFFVGNKETPKQLAHNYIEQNFVNVGVTMGSGDSLQRGLVLLNAGKLQEALPIFEDLSKSTSENNAAAKKYSGIVSLRLGDYDKALEFFTNMESDTSLYSNPGTFYKSITLLSRNRPGDIEMAKKLLRKVIDQDLEGNKEAREWIRKF